MPFRNDKANPRWTLRRCKDSQAEGGGRTLKHGRNRGDAEPGASRHCQIQSMSGCSESSLGHPPCRVFLERVKRRSQRSWSTGRGRWPRPMQWVCNCACTHGGYRTRYILIPVPVYRTGTVTNRRLPMPTFISTGMRQLRLIVYRQALKVCTMILRAGLSRSAFIPGSSTSTVSAAAPLDFRCTIHCDNCGFPVMP